MIGSIQEISAIRVCLGRFATAITLAVAALTLTPAAHAQSCARTFSADVVAIDMPLMFNRLGAQNINGMMYALKRDVVSLKDETGPDGVPDDYPDYTPLTEVTGSIDSSFAGKVALRPDKRPRPLVLRMGAGDCMEITLTNLLASANPFNPANGSVERSNIDFKIHNDDQVAARRVSLRFQGTELVNSIADDGTLVGKNQTQAAVVRPGESTTYTIYAPFDGAFMGVSYGGVVGGEGMGGQTASGLWAVLNVNPAGAVFYRSAVTQEELTLVTRTDSVTGELNLTATGQPNINYEAVYPNVEPWKSEGKAGLPVLNMTTTGGVFVHTAIDAIVAYGGSRFELAYPPADSGYGGYLGHFPEDIYPLEAAGHRNPTVPNRLEPFRELTVAFHDEVQTTQVFPKWFNDPVLGHTLHGVRDSFMINYGSGGIGAEIIANRLGIGPMHDCVNCAYEEFFLTFHTVGEVGQVTDIPANMGLEDCDPTLTNCGAVGPKANYVLYPDDPSNVHHTYIGDATAFRNLHAGPGEQHVFHLHNHQWLFNADDDNSNYLDAQGLGPGSGYAYWINFGGSGNRNRTAGDAIFHCHFYPHFAQGMWEMWRIHDTFEPGTELQVSADTGVHTSFTLDGLGIGNGLPAVGARALPDAEIVRGAPTPAVIPLPGKAMPPMPAAGVTVVANSNMVTVCADLYGNQVLADSATGACPTDTDGNPLTMQRPTGSLVAVARPNLDGYGDPILDDPDGVYGIDGVLGGGDDHNPGYPFWIAGMEHTIGNRPPTPPLDMMTWDKGQELKNSGVDLWSHKGWDDKNAIDGWDGGLPRFAVEGYSAGSQAIVAISRLDMSKEIHAVKPVFFPEEGTDLEQIAMAYHAERCHDTTRVDKLGNEIAADCQDDPHMDGRVGTKTHGGFLTNGGKPIAGAPFQEPCMDDRGRLMDDVTGWFFGGKDTTAPIWDTASMTTRGSSPYDSNTPRVYKAANVQFDAVLNKLGYHFPQQRIITLWQDVVPTIKQERPPEPFVLRMNTFDCTQYVHSNVVPKAYELDDYQVRTPTDIIGQHIHLPKWDLTSADGSANGWNYEDGTLSPEAVVEMIGAINTWNTAHPSEVVTKYAPDIGEASLRTVTNSNGDEIGPDGHLNPLPHPYFGLTEFKDRWVGARSTIQRWFADPVVNVQGVDRGLGIIFTHDHYGPSTHQQVGLYATVLIEPAGSEWVHNETGTPLYTRTSERPGSTPNMNDGGPTSWQAAILTGDNGHYNSVRSADIEAFREFYFEYTDFQHAYQPGVYVGMDYEENFNWVPSQGVYHPYDDDNDGLIDNPRTGQGPDTYRDAIQPPVRKQASLKNEFPLDIWEFPPVCPGNVRTVELDGTVTNSVPRPCPEAITADDPGMYVVNYRNESVLARIYDPDKPGPDAAPTQDCSDPSAQSGCGTQASGKAGDLAFALDSNTQREIAALNTVQGLAPDGYFDGVCSTGVFCPPITSPSALSGGDPFTPMMRVNDGDSIKAKMQSGGQEEEHAGTFYGLKWLQGGSGFGEAKNSGWRNSQSGGISEQFALRMPIYADYGQRGNQADYLYSFNTSTDGWASGTWGILRSYKSTDIYPLPENAQRSGMKMANARDFNGVCPKAAPVRGYDLTAVAVNDVLAAPANVTIKDHFPGAHVGAAPSTGGGSLVYNTRTTIVPGTTGGHEGGAGVRGGAGPLHDPTGMIYLNTADFESAVQVAYLNNSANPKSSKDNDPYCWRAPAKGNKWKYDPSLPACDVQLKPGVAVEPVVIRAAAGECLNVTLRNQVLAQAYEDVDGNSYYTPFTDYKLFQSDGKPAYEDKRGKGPQYDLIADTNFDSIVDVSVDPAPVGTVRFDQTHDLANGNALGAAVRRERGSGSQGMTSFNNNLIQPSAYVGMYPQLLELDVTRSYGMNVGQNPSTQAVQPGALQTYVWYAGHIGLVVTEGKRGKTEGRLLPTAVEFGGFGIMPADQIEQGQKGLYGAGVIYPEGSEWTVDAGGTTSATVTVGTHTFRDFSNVAAKGTSLYYGDTWPAENQLGEGSFGVAEDAQDMGGMSINYGSEPMWFRYGRNPTNASGNAKCNGGVATDCLGGVPSDQAALAFHNDLYGVDEDPQTAVFTATAGEEYRMHVLMPFGPGRGSTFDLHGHVWLRDPYICDGDNDLGIMNKCNMGGSIVGGELVGGGLPGEGSVGSQNIGDNPIGFHLGGIESWFPGQHYEIFIPSAGGSFGVDGDYLFRDHMGLGSTAGLWGIVRVEPKPVK